VICLLFVAVNAVDFMHKLSYFINYPGSGISGEYGVWQFSPV